MIGLVTGALYIQSCSVTCDAGYEGKGCATPFNAKFAGKYSVSDTVTSGSNVQVLNYNMNIAAPVNNPANIVIYNLHNLGADSAVTATVTGTSIFPTLGRIDTLFISGLMGNISDSTISIYYTLSDSNFVTENCHAIGKK